MSINRMNIEYVLNSVEPDTSSYDRGHTPFDSSIYESYQSTDDAQNYHGAATFHHPLPELPSTPQRHTYGKPRF
ncbi:hypothetical protein BDV27DRAFT_153179 [Aspergillus caelatus]|uniref:Uncharacterized protein n=2 Tax=Aspergillus subgen. Circumdati TaxID=2720871 RepID=A0A5N7AHD9_9EURO|nr:uncharacterized protein BDV27DRAFT_153179 [Aspergillus caelatus]KAE8369301.1 hypothetical protein BDV27DRAFT_153179 [Aspergillus caelatus]KAE8415227.1 hypothetical protein BDV36DRAFT_298303 [Aspergillus pseudocaelatus]